MFKLRPICFHFQQDGAAQHYEAPLYDFLIKNLPQPWILEVVSLNDTQDCQKFHHCTFS